MSIQSAAAFTARQSRTWSDGQGNRTVVALWFACFNLCQCARIDTRLERRRKAIDQMAQTNCQADGDNLLSIEMLFKRYVSYIINRLETRREKGMQLFFRQPYCSAGLMRARLNVGDHISLLAGQ